MYHVIQRSDNSHYIQDDGTPGKAEVLGRGGQHLDLYAALVEQDARMIDAGEGKPRWTVEEDGETVEECIEIEPEAVVDYLVTHLGWDRDAADRALS